MDRQEISACLALFSVILDPVAQNAHTLDANFHLVAGMQEADVARRAGHFRGEENEDRFHLCPWPSVYPIRLGVGRPGLDSTCARKALDRWRTEQTR
jgi:hypothetical protein